MLAAETNRIKELFLFKMGRLARLMLVSYRGKAWITLIVHFSFHFEIVMGMKFSDIWGSA